jgi:hypothetical protein
MVRPCGARGFVDPGCGLPSTYPASDWSELSSEPSWIAATYLKTKQPGAEVTVRDLETGKATEIKHPLDR